MSASRFAFWFFACISPALAQEPPQKPSLTTAAATVAGPGLGPRDYSCRRAIGPIKIDGKLDEKSWTKAMWTEPFVDIEGGTRPRPRHLTHAKLLWDDTYLYIGADLDEPHVWATLKAHDSVIFQDNDFEVFIDPDGDNHEYLEIELNAFNTVWDLRLPQPYRDGGQADNSFEAKGLKTAVHGMGSINHPLDLDKGWTVEMAIPWTTFASLTKQSLPPQEGDHWRLNFSRVEWRHVVDAGEYRKVPNVREENWVWSPQGVIDMHRPERWGYVHFTQSENPKFRPKYDATRVARERLHEVYYAQTAFFQKNKRWARTWDELKFDGSARPPMILRATVDGYEATAVVPIGLEEIQTISIGPRSKIKLGPRQAAPPAVMPR